MYEGIFICAGVLGFFFLLFVFILILRFLDYRETMTLAEKGLVRPERQRSNGKGALIWGILSTALGIALFLGMLPFGWSGSARYPLGMGPWMLFALVPIFFGLALILIHVLTRETKPEMQNKSTPPAFSIPDDREDNQPLPPANG